MATQVRGDYQLHELSLRLREMGSEGKGLQRELYRAINDAAKPVADQLVDPVYLYPYMPDRYADVLATDLRITTVKRGGSRAMVAIRVKGRTKDRQVRRLNIGILRHPVFADRGTPRKFWTWKYQHGGMRPGFFTNAVRQHVPDIREQVQQAMHEVGKKITS